MNLYRAKISIAEVYVVIAVCFAAFASMMSDTLNNIALYIALPSAFILSSIKRDGLKSNRYLSLLIWLYLWIFFSCLWAEHLDVAMKQMKQILGTFILCYIFAINAKNEKLVPWLYITYIVLLLADWHYAQNNIITDISLGSDRINDDKLNANSLAYHTFYVTFALYILGDLAKNSFWKRFFKGVFWATIPLSVITAIYTGSRQVLLVQIPLITFLLYTRYLKSKSNIKKTIFIISVVLASTLAIPLFSEIYEGSILQVRNEMKVNDDIRIELVHESLQVGWEYFPFGAGCASFIEHSKTAHVSHNNYLELFANEGIIGVGLYMWMVFSFVIIQWKRYLRTHDAMFLSFFIFGCLYIIDGIFFIFFHHIWLMGFFILVATHSQTYYKGRNRLNYT